MRLIKKLSFMLVYLIIPLPFWGYLMGGMYNFISIIVLFSGIPIIDYLIQDTSNPDSVEEKLLKNDFYFRGITYLYAPIQCLCLGVALYLVSTQHLYWYEWLGFGISMGVITGGLGITLAHELMHKNTPLQQLLSKLLLVTVCYGHFFIEHVRGHHVNVATPKDPASARLGESIYHFLPRTIIGSFQSAWHLETNRLKQKKHALTSSHNHFWWIIGVPVAIELTCAIFGGWSAALFFLLQSFVAILMLEVVNYIEHYGLERKKLINGDYERVSYRHSWNANHWLSNTLLLHLQRHSDHHAHGARPYQILRHIEESPQLPSGYLGMIILALFPPLWHAMMDKRVIYYQEKITSAPEKD